MYARQRVIYCVARRMEDIFDEPSLKLSASYCRVFLVIFRYSAVTRVTSVVAYSDFTSKYPDYVLSKVGLVSTKLSLRLFCKTDTKSPFFCSFSHNHEMVSAHARRGERLRDCSAQSRDSKNAQCNLEIAQILRLRGTSTPHPQHPVCTLYLGLCLTGCPFFLQQKRRCDCSCTVHSSVHMTSSKARSVFACA